MAIKLVALDVDGTLVDSPKNMEIHPRIKSAVAEAVRRGITVCIASGRNFVYAKDYLDRAGLNGPVIGCNGASVRSKEKSFYRAPLDPALVAASHRFCEEYGMTPMVFTDDEVFYRTFGSDGANKAFVDLYTCDGTAAEAFHAVTDGEYLALAQRGGEIIKMSVITNISEAHMRRALAGWQAWRAAGKLPGDPDCAVSFWSNFEIMPNGVNKGTGLMAFAKILGLDRSEVMAVGDNENDIEMIQAAGVGVAMGSGVQKLKDVADYVTLSVEEGGAGAAIEKFALGE